MKKINTLILLSLLIISFFPFTQTIPETKASETHETEWIKTYGKSGDDYGFSVVQTSDGGYTIVGTTESLVFGSRDVFLVKTDAYGNMQWNKTFGGTDDDWAYSLVKTSDEGYAIAGSTITGGGNTDFWLIKTDSSGSVQWTKTYGGTGFDEARSVIVTSDGGYALAGCTNSSGDEDLDFWFVKTDASGTMQWNTSFGGADGCACSVAETNDGGYVLAGDTLVLKINKDRYLMWTLNGDIVGNSVVATHDGGCVIAGTTESFGGAGMNDVWLVKISENGNMDWYKTYGGTENDEGHSVVETSDGGYIVAGTTESFGAGLTDTWLIKTDASGNMEWNQTHGVEQYEYGLSVVETSDDGYAIAGHTKSSPTGDLDILLIKVGGHVHNLDTSLSYTSIQAALDASETLNGHTILVDAGTYYENVEITKSISLIGENSSNTVIDGGGGSSVVEVNGVNNVTISGFTIQNGNMGIRIAESSNNNVSGNTITNSSHGIYFYNSSNNTLRNNAMNGNSNALYAYVSSILDSIHDVDDSNTVNGKPVYYWVNQHDMAIPSDAGYVALVNCTETTVENLNMTNGSNIFLFYTTNSTVKNSNFSDNMVSILLSFSHNNTVSGNTIANNSQHGIALFGSNNNTVSGNNVSNSSYGIIFNESHNNTISANTITDNSNGVCISESSDNNLRNNAIVDNSNALVIGGLFGLSTNISDYMHDIDDSNTVDGKPVYYWVNQHDMAIPSDAGYVALVNCTEITVENIHLKNDRHGILLVYTTDSVVTNSNFTDNEYGIQLIYSTSNTISGNIVAYNNYGVYLSNSDSNTFYHNDIIDNTDQTYISSSGCTWDDGYPSGGNYWSDYTGVDDNEDGIGDTPYVIDGSNRDNYPLITASDAPVHNLDTGLDYIYIQSAIDASATLNGHTILVDSGTYYETVDISKSILLIGESSGNTVIDGGGGYSVIEVNGVNNVTISGFTIQNGNYGIYIEESSDNVVTGNNITNSNYGIFFKYSANNTVSGNIVTSNEYGVWLQHSTSNIFSANAMSSNAISSLFVYGETISGYMHDIDDSNTVDGKPVYYWVNQHDLTVPSDAGYVALVNCTGIIVENLNITKNLQGVLFAYTSNSTVTNNNFATSGIELRHSHTNTISGNSVTNALFGIFLGDSSQNIVFGNNIADTGSFGGIRLLFQSSSNTFSGNNLSYNNIGVYLSSSSDNKFYSNNIIGNTVQTSISASNCTWDNGYPSGGNYWSDYTGVDGNEDGIGDTPYVIDGSNQDNYPLVEPSSFTENTFNITIDEETVPIVVASNSHISEFDFNETSLQFAFNVVGQTGTFGSCKISVPKTVGDSFEVLVDGNPISFSQTENATHYHIYFTYTHSTHNVTVKIEQPIIQYELVVSSSGSGSVPDAGTYMYDEGTQVNVTAIPDVDWKLDCWLLDGENVGDANPYTVTMDGNHTLTAVFVENPPIEYNVNSCNSTGAVTDTFDIDEEIWVKGSNFEASSLVDIYVVEDVTAWTDGLNISLLTVMATSMDISIEANGELLPTLIWSSALQNGEYDIVVDVNRNGIYDEGIDGLDDMGIQETAGFTIIPEAPLAATITLIAIAVSLLTHNSVQKRKRKHSSH